ncbi:MAG: hypothetical protein FWE85_05980 [Clostridiales bacterium]|nr:hypothetical protein [Clostridiales bacterium]
MECEPRKEAYEFAKACWEEKEGLLNNYFERPDSLHPEFISAVELLINELNLPEEKMELLKKILDTALTDAFYTLLMALDGCAGLGNSMQQAYQIIGDEDGALISECGDLEEAAYIWFHETPVNRNE